MDMNRNIYGKTWSDVLQTVAVTKKSSVLKFVCVLRGDGLVFQHFTPSSGFTVTSWTLKIGEMDKMTWEEEAVVKSDDLWALDSFAELPHIPLEFPLVSLDEPNVV
ncbi:hypothetical protein ABZP36_035009 [Zizania latifolia]